MDNKKELQGFTKQHPCCGNCVNIVAEYSFKEIAGLQIGNISGHHCKIGMFKVGKNNHCNKHEYENTEK